MQKKYSIIENKRFVNYPGEKTHSFFWKSVLMYMRSVFARIYRPKGEKERLRAWCNTQNSPHIVGSLEINSLQVTWIGHASFLIQIGGFNVLTDPVFGDLSFLFKRVIEPGILLEQLPHIDAVVISHNHRDHLDENAIRAIHAQNPRCTFFVPFGDKAWFTKRGIEATELLWWDTDSLKVRGELLKVQFLPAFHWSQRGLFDKNKSLWGSWIIQAAGKTVYFGGDTAYSSHFKQIGREYRAIDLALLPIGPCEPYKWMKFSHMNAEEAGQAALDVGARAVIPMHWGTYRFGTDSIFAPLDRFKSWWGTHINPHGQSYLYTPRCGEHIKIFHTPVPSLRHHDVFSTESDSE